MELPNSIEIRNDFLGIVNNLDSYTAFLSTEESIEHKELLDNLLMMKMRLYKVWDKIRLLAVTERKYSKAFEDLRKVLLRLTEDFCQIEMKFVKSSLPSKSGFQGELLRNLIDLLKDVSKQMKRIEKNI